jgi:hypothetical protein
MNYPTQFFSVPSMINRAFVFLLVLTSWRLNRLSRIPRTGKIWDAPTLNRFLANPTMVVPRAAIATSIADVGDRIDDRLPIHFNRALERDGESLSLSVFYAVDICLRCALLINVESVIHARRGAAASVNSCRSPCKELGSRMCCG